MKTRTIKEILDNQEKCNKIPGVWDKDIFEITYKIRIGEDLDEQEKELLDEYHKRFMKKIRGEK